MTATLMGGKSSGLGDGGTAVGAGGSATSRHPPALQWRQRGGQDTVSARRERGAINSAAECVPYKDEVGGSNPSSPTPLARAAPRNPSARWTARRPVRWNAP